MGVNTGIVLVLLKYRWLYFEKIRLCPFENASDFFQIGEPRLQFRTVINTVFEKYSLDGKTLMITSYQRLWTEGGQKEVSDKDVQSVFQHYAPEKSNR